MENGPFEDVFPIEHGIFYCHVSLPECRSISFGLAHTHTHSVRGMPSRVNDFNFHIHWQNMQSYGHIGFKYCFSSSFLPQLPPCKNKQTNTKKTTTCWIWFQLIYLKPLISSNTPIILQIFTAFLFVVFSRTFHGNRFTPRPKNDGCFLAGERPHQAPSLNHWVEAAGTVFLFAFPGDRLAALVRKTPRKSEVLGILAYIFSIF